MKAAPINFDDEPPPQSKESFETAAPVSRQLPAVQRQTKTAPSKEPPHSSEAEEHVVAVCLLDGKETIERAQGAGLTPDSFFIRENRLLFETIAELNKSGKQVSLETLVEELKTKRQLAAVGGMAYLMQVMGKVPTTAHAGYFIEKVREKHILRETIKAATQTVEEAYNFTGGLDEFVSLARARLAAPLLDATNPLPPVKPISAYGYPRDDDPNILLGSDDYLGRGGGMLFVSHAGAGKSSWIMDACMMWAVGQPWMGIRCHKPRKTLIIQAEDSDRYIGKIFTSFSHVNNLDDTMVKQLGENCIMVRLKGVSGAAFFAALKQLTDKHRPDLVVVNPIYLYAEGDITRSEFAHPFLLGLDAVNKDEKFGYILVHHTGKPAVKGKDGKRAEIEDWESAYMGFGSSYLANWPRCTILLEPIPGEIGRYQIKLGKGGLNAGVSKEVPQGAGTRLEPVTRIGVKHSQRRMQVGDRDRPVYYWEIDDTPLPEAREPLQPTAGLPDNWDFHTISSIMPKDEKHALSKSQILRMATELAPATDAALVAVLQKAVHDGEVIRTVKAAGGLFYHMAPAPGAELI
jgi:hypothetical protein